MRKAVILSGGHGTRMRPASEVINKALLPIYSSEGAVPILFYPINTLVKSGFDKLLVVSSQECCGQIIDYLGDGDRFDVDFTYKIQDMNNPEKPIGIAGALKLAKDFCGNDNFAVILGDNFFEQSFEKEANLFDSNFDFVHLFLKEVEDANRFGCASIKDDRITKIVEKPSNPKSNLAVTGFYFFTKDVFNQTNLLKVSGRGELEISDINDYYVKMGKAGHTILDSFWSDVGVPATLIRTQSFIEKNGYRILA